MPHIRGCAVCLQPADYGRHRLWASIAYGGAGPCAGATISRWGLGALLGFQWEPKQCSEESWCGLHSCSGSSYSASKHQLSGTNPSLRGWGRRSPCLVIFLLCPQGGVAGALFLLGRVSWGQGKSTGAGSIRGTTRGLGAAMGRCVTPLPRPTISLPISHWSLKIHPILPILPQHTFNLTHTPTFFSNRRTRATCFKHTDMRKHTDTFALTVLG